MPLLFVWEMVLGNPTILNNVCPFLTQIQRPVLEMKSIQKKKKTTHKLLTGYMYVDHVFFFLFGLYYSSRCWSVISYWMTVSKKMQINCFLELNCMSCIISRVGWATQQTWYEVLNLFLWRCEQDYHKITGNTGNKKS